MMKGPNEQALSREEMVRVIEGRGRARRVPVLLHTWTNAQAFQDPAAQERVRALLDAWPQDAAMIRWKNINVYDAPEDNPSYRWMPWGRPAAAVEGGALDAQSPISDWTQLDAVLEDFPSAEYPGLFPAIPADDGRYRLAHWWYTLFERHWSLRGMTNALMDFYTDPEQVHRLYDALTTFYCRMIERAHEEAQADGAYSTDDIGTQTGPFFSPEIFETFFAPYYRRLFETAHRCGMHYWLHTCGNIEPFLPRLIELGLDVIHPIQKYTMDEREIARRYGGQIAFWVGFDVQQIIPYGTPEEVRAEVRHLYDTFGRPDGRLLFTAGNGITGDTPVASLEALFEEAFAYGRRPESAGRADRRG